MGVGKERGEATRVPKRAYLQATDWLKSILNCTPKKNLTFWCHTYESPCRRKTYTHLIEKLSSENKGKGRVGEEQPMKVN